MLGSALLDFLNIPFVLVNELSSSPLYKIFLYYQETLGESVSPLQIKKLYFESKLGKNRDYNSLLFLYICGAFCHIHSEKY